MDAHPTMQPGPKLLYVGRRNWKSAKSVRWVPCGAPGIQAASFVGDRDIDGKVHAVFLTVGGLYLAQPRA